MTAPKDIDSAVAVELSGETTPSDDFCRVVATFNRLLKEVAQSACGDGTDVRWAIRSKAGGILLGFDPVADANTKRAAGQVKKSLARILNGRVTTEYRKAVRSIGTLSRTPGVHLWVGKKRTPITNELHSKLKASIRRPYRAYGSVEGVVAVLRRPHNLEIHLPIRERIVKCSAPDLRIEDLRALWQKRVTARGLVHYDVNGRSTKIEAETVTPFPDDKDLPSYMDVLGILKDDWRPPRKAGR